MVSAYLHLIELKRRTQNMLLPSLSIIFVGVASTGILMAVNWYVWGLTWASDFRQPSRVSPYGARALVEQALGQLIATNQAVLPQIVITSAHEGRSTQSANSLERADDGFKHVA
jgi:hypothetical protein